MKIMLHGYFGYGNIGDEAILEALLNELACNNIVVLSAIPNRTKKLHGVSAIREKVLSKVFWKALLSSSHLIFAGGGRYGRSTLRRMSFYILLAKLLRKSVEIRSAGIYPYEWSGEVKISSNDHLDFLTKLLLRITFNRLDFLSVRDTSSYKFLKRLGINNVRLEEDLAMKLKPKHNNELEKLVRKECCSRPIVGINLRTLKPEIRVSIISEIAKFLDIISQDGFCPFFVPFGHGSFRDRFFDNDYIVYKELAKAMNHDLYVLYGEHKSSEVLGLFRRFRAFVGMRFHSIVFAYMTGTPTIALVYDTKVKDFLETHKWSVKAINLNKLSAQQLYEAFKKLLETSKPKLLN